MSTFKSPMSRHSLGGQTMPMMAGNKLDQQIMMKQHGTMPLYDRNPFFKLSQKQKEKIIRQSTISKTTKESKSFIFK